MTLYWSSLFHYLSPSHCYLLHEPLKQPPNWSTSSLVYLRPFSLL